MQPAETITREEYLSRLARLQPSAAASIVDLRCAFLGVRPRDAAASAAERDGAAATIARVRAAFWETGLDTIRGEIRGLSLDAFPDLQADASRLLRVAELRRAFDRAAAAVDEEFMEHFRRVAVAPPGEVVAIRDRYMRRLAGPASHRNAVAAVKMLKKKFPGLYGLETDWFTQILNLKRDRRLGLSVRKVWWLVWIPVWIAYWMVISLLD